jgi:chromosomal replication initiation ATPase DnaA
MSELALAYARGAKGPIQVKQESEMLHLRKRVQELESEKASFERRMTDLMGLVEELKKNKPDAFPIDLLPFIKPDPPSEPRRIKIEEIMAAVADYYEVTRSEILGSQRNYRVTHPRHMAMYLCCKHTTWSTPALGRHLGDKDHTTIMHARDRVKELVNNNSVVAREVRDIEGLLGT